MPTAKDIVIKSIAATDARRIIKRLHYSGKVVNNSVLHFGVFLNNKCEGVMSYGSPLDKRKVLSLVDGTGWNEMFELNRMAFSEKLPRNSESRALAVSFRLIKKHYSHIKWILSFSDAAQCGDGAIYRASGFVLTKITKNNQIIEFPDGLRETRLVLTDARRPRRLEIAKKYGLKVGGASSLKPFIDIGAKPIDGYQLRYIYFIDKNYKQKLTVPIIPFSKIDEMGAGMYKGLKRVTKAISDDQLESGGAIPTNTLQY